MSADRFEPVREGARHIPLNPEHISLLAKFDRPTLAAAAAQDLKVLGRFEKKHKRYQNGGRLPW